MDNISNPPDRKYIVLFFLILLCQFVLVSITFPLNELLSNKPLLYIDNAAHWYRITLANNIAETDVLTGYDPYFGAGVPGGITRNPAAKIPAAILYLFHPLINATQSWKLYVFIASLIAPLCVPVASRLFRLPTGTAIIAGILGLCLWWISMYRWFHTAGMVSYVLSSYLALPYLASIFKYLEENKSWYYLLSLGLIGYLFTLIHPLFPIPIAVGFVSWLIYKFRKGVAWTRIMRLLLVVPTISLIPNLIWLYPTFAPKLGIIAPIYTNISIPPVHQSIVDINLIWQELFAIWKGHAHGSKLYPLLAFATFLAFLKAKEVKQQHIIYITTTIGMVLISYAALGASITILAKLTQPNRFFPTGYLFLCIPAAIGIANILQTLRNKDSLRGQRFAYISVFIIISLAIINLNELRREISYANIGHYGTRPPEVKGTGPYTEFVLHWLKTQTDKSGRVLFETANGRIHDQAHLAGYYAYNSKREFIGGPYPFSHFASFWDSYLFNRPITELSKQDFVYYAGLYNIGWIIAHSEASKRYFDNMPDIVTADSEFRELKTYKMKSHPGFFMRGSGSINRMHNKLSLANLEGSIIRIRYHYLSGMVTMPPTTLSPIYIADDPNPFIELKNPPKNVVIMLQ